MKRYGFVLKRIITDKLQNTSAERPSTNEEARIAQAPGQTGNASFDGSGMLRHRLMSRREG
jgi:hypothetical protein